MSENPYLVPSNADDDIFNPDKETEVESKHTYDGTECPECGGIIHHVSADSDMPAEVREELDRIIDSLPEADKNARVIVTTPESPASQILKDIQDFFGAFDASIAVGPALRACIETLDNMTQGQTSNLLNLYVREQQIIVYQDQVQTLDSMLGRIDKWLEKDNYTSLETLKEILIGVKNNTLTKLSKIVEDYVEACNQAERNPRQDLIDGNLEGDVDDIKYKLMFYHVTSSLARDYIHKQQANEEEE